MTEPNEDRIARLLGDRYELIELFGKGGFASVYRVRNLRLQRTEALKVLSETMTEDSDFARRFEQEARVAAALDHPNIVKIYDYGAIEDFFWFSMQFIAGPSVARELKSRQYFEDAAGARIAIGVLDALAYSHARGVIHRDIKPDNILLDREGRPYLTDFGVAKSQNAMVKTQAGTLLGSPAYMSPEQLQGKPLDGRSDLYSVGVTLYRMLSGALPFSGEDTLRATMKRLNEDPEPLLSKRRGIHPMLAEIVMRVLERDPERRFPDASSMRDELESFVVDVTPPRTRLSAVTPRSESARPAGESATPTPTGAAIPKPAGPAAEPGSPASLATPPSMRRAPEAGLRRLGWIAIAVAVAILGAVVVLVSRPRAAEEKRSGPAAPLPITARPAPTSIVAVAPALPFPTATEVPTKEPERTVRKEPTARPAAVATRPSRRATVSPIRSPTPVPTRTPTAAPVATSQVARRMPPSILAQAPMALSAEISAAHRNETVGILVIVAADGTLKTARVIDPVCPECDRAALDAVHRFRFRPATDAKGTPIEGTLGFAIRIP